MVEIDGEPWFVAKDALLAMGYPHHSHAKIREKLGGDEKAKKRVPTPSGAQQTVLVSESGLYKLTMRSDKAEAKQFQDWVTREVLPSIRKTGTYTVPGS